MSDLKYSVSIDTKSAESSLNNLTRLAAGFGAAVTAGFAAVSVGSVITQFQDLRTSLQILYKDAALGNAVFADIQNFAKSSVFSVADLTQTVIKLRAAGLNPTIAQLQLFADVSSVAADSVGALQAITDLYARTTAGGLGLEDLNRLADRGIPVFDILEKKMGLSRLQIAKIGQTAEGAQVILQALESGLNETFGGASEQRSKNLSQAISNLNDSLANFADLVGRGGLTQGLTNLTTSFGQMVTFLRPLAIVIGTVLGGALEVLAANLKFVTAVAVGFFAVMSVAAVLRLAQAFVLFNAVLGKNPIVKLAIFAAGAVTAFVSMEKATDDFTKQFDELNKKLDSGGGGLTNGKLADGTQNFKAQVVNLNEQLKQFNVDMASLVTSFARYNQENIQSIKLATELIGSGEELRKIRQAEVEINQRAQQEIAKLTEAKAKLTAEEKKEGRGATIDATIAKIKQQAEEDIKATEEAIKNGERRIQSRKLEEFAVKNQIDVNKDLRKIQDDIAKSTMSEIQRKEYDILAAAKERAQVEIEAEQTRRQSLLTDAEKQKYYDAALKGTEKLISAERKLYEGSRTFSAGWNKAFREYTDNATNAAKQAERMFSKFTSGLEDLIVNFAKTGKFEWKSFVSSMLEELLRSQIQQTFAGIMKGMSSSMGGGGGGGILDMLGGLFGGGQTPGASPQNPMYVIDLSGGGGGGGGVPFLSGGGDSGGGFLSSIGRAATGAWDTISSMGSSIVSGISDLFGGFFAGGGMIPSNKFGVVGESGPELIGGPANITPMGGGNVTYNINAVDAMSFKALVARDPGFIHAVAMQGAMSVPGRY